MIEKLQQYNLKKSKSVKKTVIGAICLIIGVLLYLIGQAQITDSGAIIYYAIGVPIGIVGLIVGAIGLTSFTKLKKDFKYKILVHMFEELMPGVSYNPDSGLDPVTVYSTEFVKRADRFHTEDLIQGKIEDVDFVSSDVKLEERHVRQTKNGTQVYYVTYFLGRIFCLDFNKEFVGDLQVLEFGAPISRIKYDKVKLESIAFNKKFKTYTTNDLTAFYILTPDIMEAIFQVEKRNPGKLSMSFHGGKLYIGVNNNRDTFELQFFRKIDESMLEEFKQDFLVVKDLVQTLKLNNKLFKK